MEDIKPITVIDIAPGTRALGVAVYEGLHLIYYGIKEAGKHRVAHTPHSRARQAAATVDQLIHKYQPQVMTIGRLNTVQQFSPKLRTITQHLTRLARHRRIIMRVYDPALVRRALYEEGRATRVTTTKQIATLYPELKRLACDVSIWQQIYYARMFTAVAAGYLCARETSALRERETLNALTTNLNGVGEVKSNHTQYASSAS